MDRYVRRIPLFYVRSYLSLPFLMVTMSKILVTYCYYFYHDTINKLNELDDSKWDILSSESR